MKKLIIIRSFLILITMLVISSCKSTIILGKKDFVNQFFNNEIVHSSLEEYYGKNITIYDENRKITTRPIIYKMDSTILSIKNTKPLDNNFFTVYDFIINKDLAFIVFSTSDKYKGILYYLKRNQRNNKWEIMEMKKRNSR